MKYDLSKLPIEWYLNHDKDSIYRLISPYYYGIESGQVTQQICNPPPNNPEAAFQFHVAAREALKKCEVSWQDDVFDALATVPGAPKCEWNAQCMAIYFGTLGMYCYEDRAVQVWAKQANYPLNITPAYEVLQALEKKGFEIP